MLENEKEPFKKMLVSVFALYDKAPTQDILRVWWAVLGPYSLEDVRAALNAHVADPKRGQYHPKPADIIAQLSGGNSGWPEVSTAWAMVNVGDEKTIVWCDEMAEAKGVAQPLIDMGDKFNAAKAFEGAYLAAIQRAKAQGKKPRTWVSLGTDKAGQQSAIDQAVAIGLLPESQALLALPEYARLPKPSDMPIPGIAGALENLVASKELTPEQRATNSEKLRGVLAVLNKATGGSHESN